MSAPFVEQNLGVWDCPHSFCDEIKNIEKWVTRDSAVSCSVGGYCLHFEGAKAERKTERERGEREPAESC